MCKPQKQDFMVDFQSDFSINVTCSMISVIRVTHSMSHLMFIFFSKRNIRNCFYSACRTNFQSLVLFAPVNNQHKVLDADRCKKKFIQLLSR